MFLTNNLLFMYTDRFVMDSPSTLRGFIANLFSDNHLLHHHVNTPNEKGLIYTYPKVQYKIIDGIPVILGINEAKEIVKTISKIDHLDLKGKRYVIIDKKLIEKDVKFVISNDMHLYKFLTPWLALDEESYSRYKKRNRFERKRQLESILVGNIISIAKGIDYIITNQIKAIVNVTEVKTKLKGTTMLGFLGTFSVNFEIPDYWGIGKSVSRGFGTIVKLQK